MNDAEAMDRLARRFRLALGDEVNGGDLVDLVAELLKNTGRSEDFTLATPANMRRFARENPGSQGVEPPRCIALSLGTGDEFSGSAGDYFHLKDDQALEDEDGEPTILVVKHAEFRDALTGEAI